MYLWHVPSVAGKGAQTAQAPARLVVGAEVMARWAEAPAAGGCSGVWIASFGVRGRRGRSQNGRGAGGGAVVPSPHPPSGAIERGRVHAAGPSIVCAGMRNTHPSFPAQACCAPRISWAAAPLDSDVMYRCRFDALTTPEAQIPVQKGALRTVRVVKFLRRLSVRARGRHEMLWLRAGDCGARNRSCPTQFLVVLG